MASMKKETNHERFLSSRTIPGNRSPEDGNALIYVLIAIALFAALSMTLGRQTDTGEASALSDEKAELYAVQLINYAAQAKSAVDQMEFSGVKIDALDFTLPNESGFNTAPNGDKIFHPGGGGLSPGILNAEAASEADPDPPAGWYMGRFNNVEWTKTPADEVILTAYQINKTVCGKINQKIAGDAAIPELNGAMKQTLLKGSLSATVNVDLTTDPLGTPICEECHEKPSLCVKNNGVEVYGFYTILADQ